MLAKCWLALTRIFRSEATLAGAAVLLASFGAHRALLDREHEQIRRTTALAAETLKTRLAAEIAMRVRPLERLAHRWSMRTEQARSEWEETASLFAFSYSGYQSIQWVDATRRVRWFAPVLENPMLQDLDYAAYPVANRAFESAGQSRSVRATPPFRLPAGELGILIAAPILRAGEPDGFIAGTLRCAGMLDTILEGTLPAGYSVAVHSAERRVYSYPRGVAPHAGKGRADSEFDVYGVPWRVSAWPTPQALIQWTSSLPQVVLFVGMVFSVLVAMVVRLAAAAHRHGTELEAVNRKLQAQILVRKRSAEALVQANDTLRAVIDTSPLAIARLAPDGSVTGWNRAAEQLFGWQEAEVLGRPMPIAGGGPDLWRVRAGQRLHGLEVTLSGRDGEPIEADVWIEQQRGPGGRIIGSICMVADARRRKQLEKQLRDSYKLDAVSRLAAGIAHNFNNLLAIIMGYSRVALDTLPAGDPLRDELHEVLSAADRAARLTVQLLAFGRGQPVRPEVVCLNRVVLDFKEVLEGIAGDACEILTPLGAELENVRIDPAQVQELLIILVVNARDAMPEGGRIVIETANVAVSDSTGREHLDVPSGLYVVLSVSDFGAGMDEETLRHLFEPFFTTKGFGPPGLGLSSVHGIAKQNGGGVAAVSEPGRGTRIEVYLPRI